MNPRLKTEAHPSNFELEAWFCGETSHISTDLESHLGQCSECKARVETMQNLGERFRFRNPDFVTLSTRSVRPSWAQRLRQSLERSRRPVIAFASFAVLMVAAALWTRKVETQIDLGYKGSVSFMLFNSKQARFEAGDSVPVVAGDTLQLALSSGATLYYRVYSRSEEGGLTLLMPRSGEPDSLSASPKGRPLPHSLVFSAPVLSERILCIWSLQPLDDAIARAFLGHVSVTPQNGVDSFQVVPAL